MPEKSAENDVVLVSELARLTGYSVENIRLLCRSGIIEGAKRVNCNVVRSGYYWVIPVEEVAKVRERRASITLRPSE